MLPKIKGEITEQIIIAELMKKGFQILRPIGDSLSFDCCIVFKNKILKIQIKTARKHGKDSVFLNLRRVRYNKKQFKSLLYNKNDVDYFFFYCYENDKIYFLKNKNLKGKHGIYINYRPTRVTHKDARYFEIENFNMGA